MGDRALPTPLGKAAQQVLDFAQAQVQHLITTYPDYFPLYTSGGRWHHEQEAWTNWCEGFLGGMLWIFAMRTGDPWWRERAEHYSRLIEPRKSDRSVHDLGFLFWPTWKRWHDLTGDERIQRVVIEAGRTLALRFNERGRYLRSFLAADSTFIDIMMNTGIIFYAAEQLPDPDLLRIATEHCLTTRRFLVRGDGSTAHEGIFDLETGAFLRQSTQQGWRADSSWARGQAWALHGFGTAYRFTGDARFLATAQQCADFYIERTPAHGVAPNDWEEPHPAHPYESSAAAIAASGLLQLADLTDEPTRAQRYREYAHTILITLCSPTFLAIETPGWEGILKHGIYHQRKNLGVDESVMWGEYFLVEALDRLGQLPGK
jgi:unsaturated chondroitin disaccharide hydrolase